LHTACGKTDLNASGRFASALISTFYRNSSKSDTIFLLSISASNVKVTVIVKNTPAMVEFSHFCCNKWSLLLALGVQTHRPQVEYHLRGSGLWNGSPSWVR